MRPVILRIEVEGIRIFKDNKISVDLFGLSNVNESDKLFMNHVVDSIYYSPVTAFVGINATGKTTAINLISSVASMHMGLNPISSTWLHHATHNKSLLNESLTLISYFYFDKKIYKVVSEVNRGDGQFKTIERSYQIENELVYSKSSKSLSKKNLFVFSENDKKYTRRELSNRNVVFSSDLSIAGYLFRNAFISELEYAVFNTRVFNEKTNYLAFKDIDSDFAKYLDSSIEYLEKVDLSDMNDKEKVMYDLKFYHDANSYRVSTQQLSKMFSIGTTKGLNLYALLILTLATGGMLFVDEIENSLNKSIVIDLIKLFYSKRSNPFGARIVFSTHYPEILDTLKRNDEVFIFQKGAKGTGNTCNNLSKELRRNDLKKSVLYSTNSLRSVSAPDHATFRKIHKSIIEEVNTYNFLHASENNDESN